MIWWVVPGAIGVALLIVVLVGAILLGLLLAPYREPPSSRQIAILAVSGIATLVIAVYMGAAVGAGLVAVPIVMWLTTLGIVRNSAPLRKTPWQRRALEVDEKKRAALRRQIAERQRTDALGEEGLLLIGGAKRVVDRILATEAAREGWLGQPDELDFAADLTMMTETLRQARRMEKLVAQSEAIPEPTDEDVQMLRDAEQAVQQLRGDVKQRVRILDDCAKQAQQVDHTLDQERERARLAERRDDARRQLAAELYGVEAAPSDPPSNAADAVRANVAAFRELKGIIDEQLRLEIDAAPKSADSGDRPEPPPKVRTWLRRKLPFQGSVIPPGPDRR